ncbi:MAG: DNA polymerase I, partial [bacterium]
GVPTPSPAAEVSARERATAIAVATAALGPTLIAEVEAGGLMALYRDLEMPLVRTLAAMEARGIGADADLLEAAGRDFSARVALLEVEIHEIAGEEFNIASTKQLRSILFEKLGLSTKGVKKGKTGYSVDADVLAKLAEQSPIAQKIVEHRTLSKLNSTYVAGLLGLIEPETGRVHTSFNQTVAATGRLSSSDPNLQNIPVRTEEGRRIRHAFVAGPGQVFLAADYSQIELRVLAHLTEDPVLVEAFGKGEDIHRRTAAEVFDVDPVFVSVDMRRQAKVINFGILYGMGPQRLSRELAISRADATGIIERYFERYASVRAFVERVVEGGRETGYVETMLGRRRPLPDLISNRAGLRQAAERMAWNSPIQGTAADIIKLAMLEVERRLRRSNSAAAMLLQVHDELFFEIPEEGAEELGQLVRDAMENIVALAVPLVVDLKKGLNWAELS